MKAKHKILITAFFAVLWVVGVTLALIPWKGDVDLLGHLIEVVSVGNEVMATAIVLGIIVTGICMIGWMIYLLYLLVVASKKRFTSSASSKVMLVICIGLILHLQAETANAGGPPGSTNIVGQVSVVNQSTNTVIPQESWTPEITADVETAMREVRSQFQGAADGTYRHTRMFNVIGGPAAIILVVIIILVIGGVVYVGWRAWLALRRILRNRDTDKNDPDGKFRFWPWGRTTRNVGDNAGIGFVAMLPYETDVLPPGSESGEGDGGTVLLPFTVPTDPLEHPVLSAIRILPTEDKISLEEFLVNHSCSTNLMTNSLSVNGEPSREVPGISSINQLLDMGWGQLPAGLIMAKVSVEVSTNMLNWSKLVPEVSLPRGSKVVFEDGTLTSQTTTRFYRLNVRN